MMGWVTRTVEILFTSQKEVDSKSHRERGFVFWVVGVHKSYLQTSLNS